MKVFKTPLLFEEIIKEKLHQIRRKEFDPTFLLFQEDVGFIIFHHRERIKSKLNLVQITDL